MKELSLIPSPTGSPHDSLVIHRLGISEARSLGNSLMDLGIPPAKIKNLTGSKAPEFQFLSFLTVRQHPASGGGRADTEAGARCRASAPQCQREMDYGGRP